MATSVIGRLAAMAVFRQYWDQLRCVLVYEGVVFDPESSGRGGDDRGSKKRS